MEAIRRDLLRALAQRVEVVDPSEIRIVGTKTDPLRTLVAATGVESAAAGVRSFIPKWRTRRDSNPWPLPSEGSALSS
jgi:site-specific DNA recombinase